MIGILNMVEKCLSLTPSQKTYLNTLLIGMMENGSIKKAAAPRSDSSKKSSTERRYPMGPWYYEVVSFDGDYVNLRRTDIESDELNPVALALLPPEIEVGSKVKCEYFQYEVIS